MAVPAPRSPDRHRLTRQSTGEDPPFRAMITLLRVNERRWVGSDAWDMHPRQQGERLGLGGRSAR